MIIRANEYFGIALNVEAKTVTVYGVRAKATVVRAENATTKKLLYQDTSDAVISYLPGRLVIALPDVTGMANTDTVLVELDINDAEFNAFLTGRLVGRGEKDVTPSDTDDLPNGPGFITIRGNAGNVTAVTLLGDVVTWAMDNKETSLVMVRQVKATGTAATNIKVIY